MISSRTGAALALLLSIGAVALGLAALMAALRTDDESAPGRLVQTRLTSSLAEQPVYFAIDNFYVLTGRDGRVRALYVYPPGHFGHDRGCKIEWRPFEPAPEDGFPGMFVDPCGGAVFDRNGVLVSGPADRGLDEFGTEPGIEGVIVDTGVLYCGASAEASSDDPTPVADIDREECEPVDAAP